MMSEWREVVLQDVVEKFIDYRGKTPQKSTSGIPLVTAKIVKYGRILQPNEFVTRETYDSFMTRGFPKVNDVVLTTEAPLGEVALLKDDSVALAQRIILLRGKENILDNGYLKYFLQSEEGQYRLDSRASGTTVFGIKASVLKEMPIVMPLYKEQKAIAEVLSSLDDKIDLLHRQNKTLEALAQTLFRQWFIEEAGDEWEEKPLSEFGDVICGKTPSKKKAEYYNGTVPFIKIPDMHGNTFIFNTTDTLTEEGSSSQKNKLLPAKSICVSCIATVGLVSMNIIESQTNQQINSIIPKQENYRYFLYLFMKSSYDLLQAMASGGTATLNLNTGDFKKMEVLKPDEDILNDFHNLVEPQFNKIFANQQQIKTLENMRDTLLPKLMSGEVRVKV